MSAPKKKAAKVEAPPAPTPRLTPPFEITDAERSEILASHRFKPDDVASDTEKCGSALDDIAYEVESLAEAITHTINDLEHDDRQSSRRMADALMAFSRSLGDVSARMMRYAGRLEAYRDAQATAGKAEDMVEAWIAGTLGKPPGPVAVGLAGRRSREDGVNP